MLYLIKMIMKGGGGLETILIVEDDDDLREGLRFALEMEGYDVVSVATKAAGLTELRRAHDALVLLDCNLPDGSGYDFLSEMRNFSQAPVLMLTARNSEMDEVKALSLGACDYMAKPFSLAVLKARIARLLERVQAPQRLTSGGVVIDKALAMVTVDGEQVTLSHTEYRLLCYFLENPGQVLTKAQILERVWDTKGAFVDENTLPVTIGRLRAKIERDPKHPALLRTVHGIGYLWQEQAP